MARTKDDLKAFAERIELRIKASLKGTDSMERLICRMMTGPDVKVGAALLAKWVEWKYGKPKEHMEISGAEGGPVVHTIRFADDKQRKS